MSQSSRPLLHDVIPLFDILEHMLEKKSNDISLKAPVHAAAAQGMAVLRKYYGKTDDSILYRCADRTCAILCFSLH